MIHPSCGSNEQELQSVQMKMIFDMRPISLARHLAMRSNKADMRTRNLQFLRLVFRDKSKSVLFATFPKSGWNWSADVINYALHKQFLGEYSIQYESGGTLLHSVRKATIFYPADARSRRQERLSRRFPTLDVDLCFHTHGSWKESPLWGLDAAKTVIVARNIPTMLFSYYRSRRSDRSFEEFVHGGALERCLKFYNSWANFARRPHVRLRVFNYEDLHKDPVGGFGEMVSYLFDVDLPRPVLQEAVDHFSLDKQKAREFQFSADEKSHFHFRGAVDYSDMMSPQTYRDITGTLSERLDPMFQYLIAGRHGADKDGARNAVVK